MWLVSYLQPLWIAFGVATIACAGWAVISGRAKYLAVAGVCLLLGAATFGADWYVVTEAEKVEAHIDELAAAAVAGDTEKVLSFLSPTAVLPRTSVAFGFNLVTIEDDLRLTDRSTEVTANDTQALSDFRANGTVRVPQLAGASKHFATKWQLVWRKEAGEWKITEVRRFNPITGEPIGLLDRM
ncbi:Cif family virulence factor [Alienimonas californiensis]|uniref:DUF4440 domain-containing protein n=1 Tax=Alienimonas californiensis TaxID=2527989 RepID=A0A517P9P8_9PLAN|nr:nuclear transport factor 2 family protein [Alienimonas californiensis]QDT16101.1 hypothetical protein CA12_21990 [Alienimonas californiensis]